MKTRHKIAIAAVAVAAIGVGLWNSDKPVPSVVPTHCTAQRGGILPDPACTPGVANPDITQATISQTICNPAWSTKSIRPSVGYTTPLKVKQIQQYGYSDTNTADYELDHLISLTDGGNPTSPQNLWPMSYSGIYGAREKDKLEILINKKICSGEITLQEGQNELSTDWTIYYLKYGLGGYGSINSVQDQDDN